MRFRQVLAAALCAAACRSSPPEPAPTTAAPTPSAASPIAAISASAARAAPARASGPRKLVWRQGEARDFALAFDRDAIAHLTDGERAVVALLAALHGSGCAWDRAPTPSRDGGAEPGVMRCALTDALGLGPQCGARHRDLVTAWLGSDAPSRCAKIPDTAFAQSVLDAIVITTREQVVTLDYSATSTEGPGGKTYAWSETLIFQPRGARGLHIARRQLTRGSPPP